DTLVLENRDQPRFRSRLHLLAELCAEGPAARGVRPVRSGIRACLFPDVLLDGRYQGSGHGRYRQGELSRALRGRRRGQARLAANTHTPGRITVPGAILA